MVLLGLGGLASAVLAAAGGHNQPGFLGTNASRSADLNLVLHLFMVVSLLVGAHLGHVRDIQAHKINQTTVVLVNLVLIASVMVVSFSRVVVPSLASTPGDPPVAVAVVHGLLGLLAEGMGIYLLLRMNGLIPPRWRFQDFKLLMRATVVQWLIVTALGVGLYWLWYAPLPASESAAPLPAAGSAAAAKPPPPTSGPGGAGPVGSLAFRDDKARNDQVQVSVDGAAPPPDGSVYVAWLSTDGQPTLRLGELALSAQNSAGLVSSAPDGANLAATFDGLALTSEPARAAGAPGDVRYRAELPPKALPFVRQILARLPGAPDNTPAAVGAIEQADALRLHADLARSAARANDVAGVQRHAEHIVNLVEGERGPNFGDRNGDGRPQNPGDGFGLLEAAGQPGYLRALSDAAAQAAASEDASPTIKVHAAHVQATVENARGSAVALRDLALQAARPQTTSRASELAEQMARLVEALAVGVDANGNGQIEPVSGEGGAKVAYLHAQFMATMPLLAVGSPSASALPAILPTQPSAAELSAAPTPRPTLAAGTTSPGAPAAFDIANFQFGGKGPSVRVGAIVTWTNKDRAPHTVTADDRHFNSGNLTTGQSFSLTPDRVGTIPYYCELHGSPGGQGMSGVLTVTP